MNLAAVTWLLGCVLLLLAVFLVLPAGVSALHGEGDVAVAFLLSAAATAAAGGALTLFSRGRTVSEEGRPDFFRREGLAAVGLAWIVCPIFGALPYLLSGALSSATDAFFESASGFTTTGSTILLAGDFDAMPRGVAFWRSFTQWIGGIGIVLVFVLLFPAGGRSLFRSEVPGIAREATMQRVRDSAMGLVRIYVVLTATAAILLRFVGGSGVTWFEAWVHSFTTLSTGGFSTHSRSIEGFGSWKVELVVVAFMFAAGVNFALYDVTVRQGIRRGWRAICGSTEVRAYAGIVVSATAVIAVVLWLWGGRTEGSSEYASFGRAVRHSAFSVVSLATSTGYANSDFDGWPDFCRLLLMMLAVVGGCAGSTAGGVKVIRLVIVARAAMRAVDAFARPRAIHSVRADGRSLPDDVVASVTSYFALWALVFLVATLALMAATPGLPEAYAGQGIVTAATSVLATLNNIGPGLSAVGPAQSFAFLPDAAKLLLAFLMILGRLEFYAVVVLFVPHFWRH